MVGVLVGAAASLSVATSAALAGPLASQGLAMAARRAAVYCLLLAAGLISSVLLTSATTAAVIWPGLVATAALGVGHALAPRNAATPHLLGQLTPFLGPVAVLFSLWVVGDEIALGEVEGWEGVAWFVLPVLGGLAIRTHFAAAHRAKVGHRADRSYVESVLLQGWIGGVAELVVILIAFATVVAAIRSPSLRADSDWNLPWGVGPVVGGAVLGSAIACALWLWAPRLRASASRDRPALLTVATVMPALGTAVGLVVLVARDGFPEVGPVVVAVALLLGVFGGNSVLANALSLNMARLTRRSVVVGAITGAGVGSATFWLLAYGIRSVGEPAPAPVPTGVFATALMLGLNLVITAVAVRGVERLEGPSSQLTEARASMNVSQDVLLFSALAVVVGAAPTLVRDAVAEGTYVLMILIVGSVVWIGVSFAVKANLDHLRDETAQAPEALDAAIGARHADPEEFVAAWVARLQRHIYWNNGVAAGLAVLGVVETVRLWE